MRLVGVLLFRLWLVAAALRAIRRQRRRQSQASHRDPRARTDRFASTAGSTMKRGRRPRRSPTSSRRNRPKARRRPIRWRCGSRMTMTRSMSARGCTAATAASRRRWAAATAPIRPSTSSSRSTRSSIAAPRSSSASPPPASASIAITRATTEDSLRLRVRSGVARRDQRRRRSVDGGAVDSVFAAALQSANAIRPGASTCHRFRPTLDEADYWILIPRTVRAWSSRFGESRGIDGIVPPRRIEALPYIAGGSTHQRRSRSRQSVRRRHEPEGTRRRRPQDGPRPEPDARDRDQPRLRPGRGRSGGSQPDRVRDALPREAAVLSRRRAAVQHRPSELLLLAPHRRAADRAGHRRLRGLSGRQHDPRRRQADRTAAVEDLARLHRRGDRRRGCAQSPSAGIAGTRAIVRSRRTPITSSAACCRSSARSASTAGFIVNYMHRDLEEGSPLADLYTRNALGVAGNTLLRFKGGQYEFRASGGGSFLNGSEKSVERCAAIELALRAAPRSRLLAARSDADVAGGLVDADELRQDRRPALAVGREHQDRFREFRGQRLRAVERRRRLLTNANIRYRETQPGKVFRNYYVAARRSDRHHAARPACRPAACAATFNVTWLNFWTSQVQRRARPRHDQRLADARRPADGARAGLDHQHQLRQSRDLAHARERQRSSSRPTTTARDASASAARSRCGPGRAGSCRCRRSTIASPSRSSTSARCAAGGRSRTTTAMCLPSSIAARCRWSIRLGLTLKPDINLDVYAEPFAASGHYYDYGELLAAGQPRAAAVRHQRHSARRATRWQPAW